MILKGVPLLCEQRQQANSTCRSALRQQEATQDLSPALLSWSLRIRCPVSRVQVRKHELYLHACYVMVSGRYVGESQLMIVTHKRGAAQIGAAIDCKRQRDDEDQRKELPIDV